MTAIKEEMKEKNQEKIDSLLDLLKTRDGFYDKFINISLSLKEICLKIKSKKLEELKEDIINYFEKELPGFLWDKDWENDTHLISSNLHILHKIDSLEAPTKLKGKIKKFLETKDKKTTAYKIAWWKEERKKDRMAGRAAREERKEKTKAEAQRLEEKKIDVLINNYKITRDEAIKRLKNEFIKKRVSVVKGSDGQYVDDNSYPSSDEEQSDEEQSGGAATVPTPLFMHDKLISDKNYHRVKKRKLSKLYSGVALNKDSINEDDMISFIGEVKKILKGEYETYITLLIDNNLLRQPTDHELRIGGVEIVQGPNRYVSSLVKEWIEYTIVKDFEEYVNSINLEKLCEDIIESETYSPENLSKIFDATKNQHDELLKNNPRYADNISKLYKVFARFKLNDDMEEFLTEVRTILNTDEERVKDYIELLKSSKLIKPKDEQKERAVTTPRISRSSSSSDSYSYNDSRNQFSALTLEEGSINSKYKVKLIKL
jgi:hypothetical protein